MPIISAIGGGKGGGGSSEGFPIYTYTGQSQLIDDDNGDWKLKLLTSGTLEFQSFGKGAGSVDIFLVGGGGGGGHGRNGGGGGYTNTLSGYVLTAEQEYPAVIGAGGIKSTSERVRAGDGGVTSFDTTNTANGGQGGIDRQSVGSTGGSGGGVGAYAGYPGAGGENGGNGGSGDSTGGIGQGSTTREFGEATGMLYAGGGGGAGDNHYGEGGSGGGGRGACPAAGVQAFSGTVNTGGGGGGGNNSASYPAGDGGSGIVIIRNHRAAPDPLIDEFELINEITTTETVNNIRFDEDANGHVFALKKAFVRVVTPSGFSDFLNFYVNALTDTNIGYIGADGSAFYANVYIDVTPVLDGGGIVQAITAAGKNQGTSEFPRMTVKNGASSASAITWFEARLYGYGNLPSGITVELYGVRK